MYKSPIDVLISDVQRQIAEQHDEEVYKAVVSVGINVDKDELIRALAYDRHQYMKGYADGKADATPKWIPVTERLPESEKCVLIYSKDGKVAEGKYNARFDEWTQFRWNVTEVRSVTHWMPLPSTEGLE